MSKSTITKNSDPYTIYIDMASPENYYEELGIQVTATPEEIREAYIKLAKEYHPDRNKTPRAEENFKKLKEAKDILSDPKKRAAYDAQLKNSSTDKAEQTSQGSQDYNKQSRDRDRDRDYREYYGTRAKTEGRFFGLLLTGFQIIFPYFLFIKFIKYAIKAIVYIAKKIWSAFKHAWRWVLEKNKLYAKILLAILFWLGTVLLLIFLIPITIIIGTFIFYLAVFLLVIDTFLVIFRIVLMIASLRFLRS